MRVACACGAAVTLYGVQMGDPRVTTMEVEAARALGWKSGGGVLSCPRCSSSIVEDAPAATEPAPPLSPAEGAQRAIQRLENALDRVVLRSGVMRDDEVSEARQALTELWTFVTREVERCKV